MTVNAPRALRHSRGRCLDCGGAVYEEDDPYYGPRWVCVWCGKDEWKVKSFAERTPRERWLKPGNRQ